MVNRILIGLGALLFFWGCQKEGVTPTKPPTKKITNETNVTSQPPKPPKPLPPLIDFQDDFSVYPTGINPPFGKWVGKNAVIAKYFQPDNTPGNVIKFNSGIICDTDVWGDFNLTANYKTFTIGMVAVDLKPKNSSSYYQIQFQNDWVEVDKYIDPFRSVKLFSQKLQNVTVPPNEWMKLRVEREKNLVKIAVNDKPIVQLKLKDLQPEAGINICFEGNGINGALLDNVEILGYRLEEKKKSGEKGGKR
ncbi:MAG: hypothetical protein C6I01_03970 [Epsilonproteobacteria bacterium]|nr:hypothetical protein [Campylobacterota bacterium]NPA89516.1 hypothetical protein [Campylobacterota bacterium]